MADVLITHSHPNTINIFILIGNIARLRFIRYVNLIAYQRNSINLTPSAPNDGNRMANIMFTQDAKSGGHLYFYYCFAQACRFLSDANKIRNAHHTNSESLSRQTKRQHCISLRPPSHECAKRISGGSRREQSVEV